MAEGKICVCPQCGKKFKLKPEFASASFACTACSATVWVDGKPKGPSKSASGTRRKAGGSRAATGGSQAATGGSRAATGGRKRASRGAAAGGRRRSRRSEEPAEQEEQGRRGSRYQKDNSSQNVVIAVVGLVVIVGLIAFLLMKGGDEDPTKTDPKTSATSGANGGSDDSSLEDITDGTENNDPTDAPDENADDQGGTDTPPEDQETAAKTDGNEKTEDKPRKALKKTKTKYRIDKKTGRKVRISRWNPPEDMGHLKETPADERKVIDDLLTLVFDPLAGKASLSAKQKLAIIGKPAYLPILASIRNAKKTMKWDNQHDDNLLMSSAKLADECLRIMDGYLEANGVGVIRPGTPENFYNFVIRMHYKRWIKTLADLDTMPGPYDPSSEYETENEESE